MESDSDHLLILPCRYQRVHVQKEKTSESNLRKQRLFQLGERKNLLPSKSQGRV